jgi:hypothetical protein
MLFCFLRKSVQVLYDLSKLHRSVALLFTSVFTYLVTAQLRYHISNAHRSHARIRTRCFGMQSGRRRQQRVDLATQGQC